MGEPMRLKLLNLSAIVASSWDTEWAAGIPFLFQAEAELFAKALSDLECHPSIDVAGRAGAVVLLGTQPVNAGQDADVSASAAWVCSRSCS
jgi:hypothetical protein